MGRPRGRDRHLPGDGARAQAFHPGNRPLFAGRGPNREDRSGFRAEGDAAKNPGERTNGVAATKADTTTVEMNGATKGDLPVQSDGAKVLFKRISLTSPDGGPGPCQSTARSRVELARNRRD